MIGQKHTGKELGEFETLMQTRDEVEGLHNFRDFSQPLVCLYQAMEAQQKISFVFKLFRNPPQNSVN